MAVAVLLGAWIEFLLGYSVIWNLSDANGTALGAVFWGAVALSIPAAGWWAQRAGTKRAEAREVVLLRVALTTGVWVGAVATVLVYLSVSATGI
jgi:hypothetical protein